MTTLINKIDNYKAVIGILGLGYVGLPLAVSFSKHFKVIGYDPNKSLIERIETSDGIVNGISLNERNSVLNKTLFPSYSIGDLDECDIYIICVPTPLKRDKKPDLSYIRKAAISLIPFINKNKLVVLESTTYPGTTEEILSNILEKSGYKAGSDFYVAFSPERIDPGNPTPLEDIPKVVGGLNKESTELCLALYSKVFKTPVEVSNSKTAEAVKLYENIFRLVNIGLINELSLIFDQLGINTWEVIRAASTKPYGFMPFYPGPGVGGHCIPLDPFYLTYRAERSGLSSQFINLADQINEYMKLYVVGLIESSLKTKQKSMIDSTVSIFGLTYKRNIDDIRESPSIIIIEELMDLGCEIKLYDPYVNKITINGETVGCEENIENAFYHSDCAVFLVNHTQFNEICLDSVSNLMETKIIIDCKNIFKNSSDKVFLTGIGKNIIF
ncbi:MAG: nucleotide sugar dehydrogenase [Candidatus Helarchaeota archaeon]